MYWCLCPLVSEPNRRGRSLGWSPNVLGFRLSGGFIPRKWQGQSVLACRHRGEPLFLAHQRLSDETERWQNPLRGVDFETLCQTTRLNALFLDADLALPRDGQKQLGTGNSPFIASLGCGLHRGYLYCRQHDFNLVPCPDPDRLMFATGFSRTKRLCSWA